MRSRGPRPKRYGAASSPRKQMNEKRPNQQPEKPLSERQLLLPFAPVERGESPSSPGARVEAFASPRPDQSPTIPQSVMQEVLQPENLKAALRQVQSNKGAPGIDGMTVKQLAGHLLTHWAGIRQQLLEGTYQPRPVRRVEIPKPD